MGKAIASATKHLVSIDEAARFLSCNPRTVRRMIARGEITGYRVSTRLLRVDLAEIEARALRPIVTTCGGAR